MAAVRDGYFPAASAEVDAGDAVSIVSDQMNHDKSLPIRHRCGYNNCYYYNYWKSAMQSIQPEPLRTRSAIPGRPGAMRLAIVAATLLLSACGVINNRKPIPPGTPTAHVHFGPVTGGLRTVAIAVRDGAACHPDQFRKGGVIGSYLGSDLDMDVPANTKLFFIVGDHVGIGTTEVRCGGTIAFAPEPGAQYTVNLIHPDKQCGIVVQKNSNGVKVPVPTEVVPGTCLY